MPGFHLAQVNVGRLRAPIDAPELAGFVAALEPVNALADAAPGFVWRLQTEDGDATAIRPFDDEMIAINLSVWESLGALADFVYSADHAAVMRGRRQWFERMEESYLALWWIPAGELPSVADARARLEHLRSHGPSPHGFTFRQHFLASGEPGNRPDADADDWRESGNWTCPTG